MSIKIMCHYDGIEVINICDLMAVLDPEMNMSYYEASAMVKNWCEENDANYYGKPKANFFVDEAISETKKTGKTKVVIEDLS